MSEQANAPHFAIEKIYLKDASFESPMAPQVFTMPFDSSLDLQVKVEPEQVGEQHWQVTLRITATVRLGEQVAFLAEVEQAGLFAMANFEAEAINSLINSYCPTLLFPYARETIANLSLKAGFPPLELQPINFEALHNEQMANEQG
jgi:preprotein translocase subunit SecB